jgi:hypothetical protein
LQDAGIALSLSQGTMSVRLSQFDKDKTYFEIDAPKTTVAIQKAGRYRIDAGFANSAEARITVTENGEARIYSDDAAFTLRSGRSARIQLDGDLSGNWEMADASATGDEFDGWSADRDRIIADLIKNSYYDQYYDRDIYGAEDLTGYGEWIHTNKYGYVWRPYQSAISRYDNWSPYRYGQWRWIPPFGWTWVNDEPWGWATYHHGRWFYDNGYWAWAPYGYLRPSRSWWLPALVSITIVNDDVCWYPLPYHASYRDYNRHHKRDRNRDDWRDRRSPDGRPWPSASPPPVVRNPNDGDEARRWRGKMPPAPVPTNGIVTVASSEFGRGARGYRTAPVNIANTVISKPVTDADQIPDLPSVETVRSRMTREIRANRPQNTQPERVRTGVAERKTGVPMDTELRKTRILDNRPPVRAETNETRQVEQKDSRGTGVTRRRETKREETPLNPTSPVVTTQPQIERTEPSRRENRRVERPSGKQEQPVTEPSSDRQNDVPKAEAPRHRQEEPKAETPRREEPKVETPKREEPIIRPQPKQDANPEREERRNNPPPREDRRAEPPRQETPRYETPKKEEPRNEPPAKRDDPPPQKSEPKEDRHSLPAPMERKKDPKDGRR